MKVVRLSFIQRRNTTGFSVLAFRFACILIYRLSLNYSELHQEPLHCHQLEEELDDWCPCWYFQNGIGLGCRSPDSWCRRFNVDNASLKPERFLNFVCIENILIASCNERLVRKIVHFDPNFFISIMFEPGCTKFRIFQEAIVNPLKMLLDASLSRINGNVIPMATKSSLLNGIVLNWEKVQCTLNGASTGFTFFQEIPANCPDNLAEARDKFQTTLPRQTPDNFLVSPEKLKRVSWIWLTYPPSHLPLPAYLPLPMLPTCLPRLTKNHPQAPIIPSLLPMPPLQWKPMRKRRRNRSPNCSWSQTEHSPGMPKSINLKLRLGLQVFVCSWCDIVVWAPTLWLLLYFRAVVTWNNVDW